jgi:hypothetical protein
MTTIAILLGSYGFVKKSSPPTPANIIITITIEGIYLDLELTMLPPEDVNSMPYGSDINLALREILFRKTVRL